MFHSLSANNKKHFPYFSTAESIPSSQIQHFIGRLILCILMLTSNRKIWTSLSVLNAEALKHCLIKQNTRPSMSTDVQKINTGEQKKRAICLLVYLRDKIEGWLEKA